MTFRCLRMLARLWAHRGDIFGTAICAVRGHDLEGDFFNQAGHVWFVTRCRRCGRESRQSFLDPTRKEPA